MTLSPANRTAAAILVGFAMLSAAVLVSNHWSINRVGPMQAILLNRWTGSVEACAVSDTGSVVKMECLAQ